MVPSAQDEQLVREKQEQAIRYLHSSGIDAWLVFVREGSDPTTTAIISGAEYIVQNAAFILTRDGRRIAVLQPIDVQNKAGVFFDETVPCGDDVDQVVARTLRAISPMRLAVNFSRREFCADGLTHGMYLRLMDILTSVKLQDRVMSAEDVVVHLRAIKTGEEIQRMRKAAEITATVAEHVMSIMKNGVTQRNMIEFFGSRASDHGASGLDANVAANPVGENDKGLRDRPLQPGDVVLSDMGAVYRHYHADLKRCWYILHDKENQAPELLTRQWQVCHETLAASLNELRTGRPGFEVHDAAWSVMERLGFKRDQHSFGHQVGRRAHDAGPWLGDKDNIYRPATAVLQENMVVTLDPTMNRVGKTNPQCYSVGLEEMAIVKTNGGELIQDPQREIFLVRLR